MKTIPINIIVRSDGIDVNPTYANVENASQDVQLRWNVVGATLAATDFFAWKDSPTGAPTVSRSSDTVLLSSTYQNNSSHTTRRVWRYRFTIIVDGVSTPIDPEINNEPPGT